MKTRFICQIFCLCMLIFFVSFPTRISTARDDSLPQSTVVLRGIVGSVDWVGSLIVVDDVRVSVADNTEIYKGDTSIWFSDIHVGDSVVITCHKDEKEGSLTATRITVKYSGDMPV